MARKWPVLGRKISEYGYEGSGYTLCSHCKSWLEDDTLSSYINAQYYRPYNGIKNTPGPSVSPYFTIKQGEDRPRARLVPEKRWKTAARPYFLHQYTHFACNFKNFRHSFASYLLQLQGFWPQKLCAVDHGIHRLTFRKLSNFSMQQLLRFLRCPEWVSSVRTCIYLEIALLLAKLGRFSPDFEGILLQ